MRIVFTKSTMPLSYLIRWGLDEDCSHFALIFDEKLVVHSNLYGVHIQWLHSFQKHCTIVHEMALALPLEKEEELYQSIMDNFDECPYDFGAFTYFCWRGFLKKIFKRPMPPKNPWGSKRGFLCTEMAKFLPEWLIGDVKDFGMMSPHMVWEKIKDKQQKDEV